MNTWVVLDFTHCQMRLRRYDLRNSIVYRAYKLQHPFTPGPKRTIPAGLVLLMFIVLDAKQWLGEVQFSTSSTLIARGWRFPYDNELVITHPSQQLATGAESGCNLLKFIELEGARNP